MLMNKINILKTICGFVVLNGIFASFAFAGSLDVGFIGSKVEVILFYKDGDLIIVKKCVDLTILKEPGHREGCIQRPGTYKAEISVTEFKNRLKAALRLPVGNYTSLMKQKIEVYNKQKGQLDEDADLKRQQSEVKSTIDRIKAFLDKYGKNADLEGEAQLLETKLASIEQELTRDVCSVDVCSRDSISEVNQAIEDLIHKILDSSSLTEFVYSQNETGFEFNILKSYVDHPGISTATFAKVKAGTFLMGSPSAEKNRNSIEEFQHKVTLTKDFEIQKTEVTQLQYFLIMGYNPSHFKQEKYCSNEHVVINGEEL